MTVNNIKYSIGLLPTDCIAYKGGYRYGACRENLKDKRDTNIVEFFKTLDEVQKFVNENREYGKAV